MEYSRDIAELAQDIEIVVSSHPQGAMRVTLLAIRKMRKTVLHPNTMISGNMKLLELSTLAVIPQPRFVARWVPVMLAYREVLLARQPYCP